jgi:hypothetical protein
MPIILVYLTQNTANYAENSNRSTGFLRKVPTYYLPKIYESCRKYMKVAENI